MASTNDLALLKAEQQKLRQKLLQVESQQHQLSSILVKKNAIKSKSMDINTLHPYRTVTVDGICVQEYAHAKSVKTSALALPPMQRPQPKPTAISGSSSIGQLRIQNIKRKVDRNEAASNTRASIDIFDNRKASRQSGGPGSKIVASLFPNRYKRGELPCSIEHGSIGNYLSWVCPLEKLDYEYYLPLFFDGLQCKDEPYHFLATQGVKDLLQAAKGAPERIIPCVDLVISPIRSALQRNDKEIAIAVLQ
eukprot:gene12499-26309_t